MNAGEHATGTRNEHYNRPCTKITSDHKKWRFVQNRTTTFGVRPGLLVQGHYNLINVLYHVLHGAENCGIYAPDAEEVGDEQLVAFFQDAQTAQRQLAERAKELLGIGGVAPEAGGVTTLGTAEPGTVIPPETPTGEVPPEGIVRPEAWRETAPGTPTFEEDVDVAPPGRGEIPPEAPRTVDVRWGPRELTSPSPAA